MLQNQVLSPAENKIHFLHSKLLNKAKKRIDFNVLGQSTSHAGKANAARGNCNLRLRRWKTPLAK